MFYYHYHVMQCIDLSLQCACNTLTSYCSVHTKIEEKIVCVASRAGALENLEISGTLYLLVSDSAYDNIAIKITANKQAQYTVSS